MIRNDFAKYIVNDAIELRNKIQSYFDNLCQSYNAYSKETAHSFDQGYEQYVGYPVEGRYAYYFFAVYKDEYNQIRFDFRQEDDEEERWSHMNTFSLNELVALIIDIENISTSFYNEFDTFYHE